MRYLNSKTILIALGVLALKENDINAATSWEVISDGSERQGGKSFGTISQATLNHFDLTGSLFALPGREPNKRVGFVIAKTINLREFPCTITFIGKSHFVPSLYIYTASSKAGLAYVWDLEELENQSGVSTTFIDPKSFRATLRGKPVEAPMLHKADITGFGVGLKRSNQDAVGLIKNPLEFSTQFVLNACEEVR